jgi:hypothetical protein
VERAGVAVEDHALAAREPDRHPGADLHVAVAGREPDLADVHLGDVERADLAQRLVAEHDVAAEPQLEALDRGLEGEAAPVDGRGERQDRGLDLRP